MTLTQLHLDPSQITGRDLLDFEETTGSDLMEVLHRIEENDDGSGALPIRVREMFALVWVMGRKQDTSLTYEAVLDIPLEQLQQIEFVAPDPSDDAAGSSS